MTGTNDMLLKASSFSVVVFLLIVNIWLILRQLNTTQCNLDGIYYQGYVNLQQESQKKPRKHIAEPLQARPEQVVREYEVNEVLQTGFNVSFDLGRWDKARLYKMYDFVYVGRDFAKLSKQFTVCLATQSSIERIESIVAMSQQWSGPISAALYAAGDDEYYLLHWYIEFLKKCFVHVGKKIAFHLAVPRARMPGGKYPDILKKLHKTEYKCIDYVKVLKEILQLRSAETVKWRTTALYPQNHLRNLARRNCQNLHVFLIDVDIIPSSKMAEHVDSFLKSPRAKCQEKCAYVIPTYELDERTDFPKNKSDLIRLKRKGLAQAFHHKIFIYNQYATNFTRWESFMDVTDGNVVISHEVTNFEFLYEPFYVAPDTVPEHDERFLGYGYTRNTQVYETFVAGYKFQVLSPVFTIHWGMVGRNGRPAWRERQNSMNRQRFEVFKREVFARYRRDPLKMMH
ncbi:hypothetical protein RUM43_005974 [Polyplax serrata]|uniref:Beta-1,4-glucuronyltransferase 1 n=1 Tax=Polyplax serrata TaxID=468196 RepID=A0AAN8S385_POLSC